MHCSEYTALPSLATLTFLSHHCSQISVGCAIDEQVPGHVQDIPKKQRAKVASLVCCNYRSTLLDAMPTVAIKPGATVFVTGVNGLVGSHVVDQLLKREYNVRGAVRDAKKHKYMTKYFNDKYKEAKFELVVVPDMTVEGSYDDVVDGMSKRDSLVIS